MESKGHKGAALAAGFALVVVMIWLFAGNHPASPAPGTPDAGRAAPKPGPVAVAPGSDDLTCRPPPDMETPPAPVAPPSFAGVVTDALTEAPLAGVTIRVEGPRTGKSERHEGKTDAKGRFEFRSLAAGDYAIQAAPSEEQVGLDYLITYLDDTAVGNIDLLIRMARGRSIAGTVRDERGAAVAATVRVEFIQGLPQMSRSTTVTGHTNPDATFVVHGIPDGTWDLTADADDEDAFVNAHLRGVAAGTTDLALVLVRGAPIRGRIRAADGGDLDANANGSILCVPQGGDTRPRRPGDARNRTPAEMQDLLSPSAQRFGDGTFKTATLPLGTTWDLVADGFAGSVPVRVPGIAAGAKDVEIRLDAGGSVSGTVLGPDGKPVGAGIPVWADVAEGIISNMEGKSSTGYTKADGTFLLSGLGNHTLRLGAGGLDSEFAPTLASGTVTPGAKGAVVNVTACALFAGRLLDARGEPMADCAVIAIMKVTKAPAFTRKEADGNTIVSPPGTAMTRTDADGRFAFRGLGEGAFSFTARDAKGRSSGFQELRAPASDAVVTWKEP